MDKCSYLNTKKTSFVFPDLIGEGAFSKVFKGTFQSSEVAIKQLKIALIEQDRNYFTAEVSQVISICLFSN